MGYNKVRRYSSSGRKKTQTELIEGYLSLYKVRCKCSHTMYMPYNVNKVVCNYCGNFVYKNKREEFKDTLKKVLKRKEKENDS